MVSLATEMSYAKSAAIGSDNKLSRQTVKNHIKKLKPLEKKVESEEQKRIKELHIYTQMKIMRICKDLARKRASAVRLYAKAQADYENICKRKETILSSVEEQGKLTEELRKRIEASYELTELEDLYLPYKKKRKTKGDVAKENGLEQIGRAHV